MSSEITTEALEKALSRMSRCRGDNGTMEIKNRCVSPNGNAFWTLDMFENEAVVYGNIPKNEFLRLLNFLERKGMKEISIDNHCIRISKKNKHLNN